MATPTVGVVIPAYNHRFIRQGNRKSILDKEGPFDEMLQGCVEWDLWLRLSDQYES